MADDKSSILGQGSDDENEIIRLANRIAKKDLRLIAEKGNELSTFDEARIVTAYKQAAVRSKGEARAALSAMDLDGLSVEEVERMALELSRRSGGGDDDE